MLSEIVKEGHTCQQGHVVMRSYDMTKSARCGACGKPIRGGAVDTTRQLKVGQIVELVSGAFRNKVRVLEIAPTSAIVQEIDTLDKIRLDISGRAMYSGDLGWIDFHGDFPFPGTFEHGPWQLE